MASISGTVTIAGDPDDWIATAFDAATHEFAGVAAVSAGEYEITGLTAGKAYMVACRPKTGGVWMPSSSAYVLDDIIIPTNPISDPYIYKATTADAGGDPHFDKVAWLLHFEGENNSTTFVDVIGNTATPYDGAKISTAQYRFGASSVLLDGSADYVTLSDSQDFDIATNEDFTFECWIRRTTNLSETRTILGMFSGTTNPRMTITTAGKLYGQYGAFEAYGSTTVTADNWHHVAMSRSSNAIKLFLNGQIEGSGTVSTGFSPTNVRIGARYDGAQSFSGYIDEVRGTIGYSRYSDTFTPPDQPFPDVGGTTNGATEPNWPTTPGNTVADGGVTWTNMGRLVRPLMHGPLIAA